ncbi:MAG TPA: ABC transporter permease [Thermomicrobiales bacterium]|nr:ABC transporter permease [Thermomicrobiales bacterium]
MSERILAGSPGGITAAARPVRRISIMQRLSIRGPLLLGLMLIVVILLIALFAPLLAPYDPIAQDLSATFAPPFSPGHLLGTDNYGRDVLSRIIFGARLDLQIGFVSVLFPFLAGSLLGVVTGYLGGWLDNVVMRVVDVLLAFPFLVLVIALMTLLGPGLRNLYIAVGVFGWITYARLVRGETLIARNLEYVQAAKAIGCTNRRVMVNHLAPNVMAPSLVYVFTGMVQAILTGASLSFLGLGPQPPAPEWGAMIAEGRQFLLQAWWMPTLPGLAILVTGVALSLIGDGLAERRR